MSGERRALVGGCAVLLGVAAAAIGLHGRGVPGAEVLLRWTARNSFALFLIAFIAPLAERSSLGIRRVAFPLLAVSHTVHLAAILWLALLTDGENVAARANVVLLGSGVVAYSAIYFLASRPAHPRADLGLVWLWVVFSGAYLPRVQAEPASFGVAGVLLLLSLLVRLPGLWRAIRPGPATP